MEGLTEQGHEVTKKQVILGHPIKTIGMFDVLVRLHAEVDVTVKANVARSDDEAELQRQGVDVLADNARTIGYEILTSLGARYRREYVQ